jgi:hypothetical protein
MRPDDPPTLLEYAPATCRAPMGGLLFRPSRWSLILLLLAAAGIVWLSRRHSPWCVVAQAPSADLLGRAPVFTPDNAMLAVTRDAKLVRIDLTDGRVTQSFAQLVMGKPFQCVPFDGGRRIAIFTDDAVA